MNNSFPNLFGYQIQPLPRFYYFYAFPEENPPSQKQQSSSVHVNQTENIIKSGINFVQIENSLRKLHQGVGHRKTHWSAVEDKLLERLVQIQKLEWREIPVYFKGRTQNMCYSRYRRISMSTKDKIWRKEQQQYVAAYVSRFGEKWQILSSKMPKFTSKQIRERYLNYLRPNISKDDFSFQQDLKICNYVLTHGRHWKKMQQILPNRGEGYIKNRYYSKLQKLIQESIKDSTNF